MDSSERHLRSPCCQHWGHYRGLYIWIIILSKINFVFFNIFFILVIFNYNIYINFFSYFFYHTNNFFYHFLCLYVKWWISGTGARSQNLWEVKYNTQVLSKICGYHISKYISFSFSFILCVILANLLFFLTLLTSYKVD